MEVFNISTNLKAATGGEQLRGAAHEVLGPTPGMEQAVSPGTGQEAVLLPI